MASSASSSKPTTPLPSATDPAAVEAACREHGLAEPEFRELHRRCVAAKATAYCPYSRFRVGASTLSREGGDDGSSSSSVYIDGANVENASYPVGTCAERVALGKAVTGGHRRISAIAVATDISPPASPCKPPPAPGSLDSTLSSPFLVFPPARHYGTGS